jgi:UDP-GlcNAc3NAcA epimerase
MKIATVIGARPQFIKASAISRELSKRPNVSEIIIHTGQHHDENMSEIFFKELNIPTPKYNLNIHGGTHAQMTGRMMVSLEEVFIKESPDVVLIYGDTNSTLAAAVAAAKLNIPIAHVEAGLRSFNRRMPEEINRILSDQVSDWLFAPTDEAEQNLKNEGISLTKIFRTGDVMLDTASFVSSQSLDTLSVLNRFNLDAKSFALITVHRAENTDNSESLIRLLKCLDYAASKIKLVFPIHPRTKIALAKNGLLQNLNSKISLVEPLGYTEMIHLEKSAKVVITDSGGVQKEAFFHSVPCITMRNETEWVELVAGGWNKLTGLDFEKFVDAFNFFMNSKFPPFDRSLYGDGNASKEIVDVLINHKQKPQKNAF